MAADQQSITLNGALASDLDVGIHNMQVTVTSLNYTSTVSQQIEPFVVDLQACVVSNFTWVSTVSSFTYMLTDPAVFTNSFLAT
jgi:hypothetical protein